MSQIEILLATYQGAAFLSQQLDSLFQQHYQDWSLLVRDDGSTDDTLEIIQRYQEKYPTRIRILDSGQNGGAPANFAVLLQASTAPYVMCCDQDDLWKPEKILLTLQTLQSVEKVCSKKMPCLVHTDLEVVTADLTPISPSFWRYASLSPQKASSLPKILSQNVVTGCTMMVNRALLDKALPIPKDSVMHDWWLALVAAACGVVQVLPHATMLYRQHANNVLGAQPFDLRNVFFQAIQRLTFSRDPIQLKKAHNHRQQKRAQASALLQRLNSDLSATQKELIQAYCNLEDKNYISSRLQILKYGFLKQGILRNINLLTSRSIP